jgi:hypothetical protein
MDSSESTELSIFSEALIPLIRIPISFENYSPYSFFFDGQEETVRERSMETYIREKYRKKENIRIALPIREYSDTTSEKANFYCTICLNMIIVRQQYYELECGHCFHDLCIEEAVKFQHLECPLCRNRIPHCTEEEEIVVESSLSMSRSLSSDG